MDFLTRRSIRKYQDRKVEKEVIEQLMKTAVVSPSGRNGRPYEFVVVDDKEIIKKLAHSKESGAQFAENAPLSNMISLGYPAEERPAYTEKDMDMTKVHFNKW